MNKELLQKLLNDNKRLEVVKKDTRKVLKVVLMAFNGKKIVKETKDFIEGLKEDTTVIFKPVKAFMKKQLKGLDAEAQAKKQLEFEEEQRKRKEKQNHISETVCDMR